MINSTDLPCLTKEPQGFCENKLGEKESYNALKSMTNNKTSRNDGLRKGLYEAFQIELKDPLLKPFCHTVNYKEFSNSQRQAVIKIL